MLTTRGLRSRFPDGVAGVLPASAFSSLQAAASFRNGSAALSTMRGAVTLTAYVSAIWSGFTVDSLVRLGETPALFTSRPRPPHSLSKGWIRQGLLRHFLRVVKDPQPRSL